MSPPRFGGSRPSIPRDDPPASDAPPPYGSPSAPEAWSPVKLTFTLKQLLRDFAELERTVEHLDDVEANSAVTRARDEAERAIVAKHEAEEEARAIAAAAEKRAADVRDADRAFLVAHTKQLQRRAAFFSLLAALAGAGILWLVSHFQLK